jgi:hypothetical protein
MHNTTLIAMPAVPADRSLEASIYNHCRLSPTSPATSHGVQHMRTHSQPQLVLPDVLLTQQSPHVPALRPEGPLVTHSSPRPTCILLRASVSGSEDTCPAVIQGCFMHSAAVSLRPGSTTSSLRIKSLALHGHSKGETTPGGAAGRQLQRAKQASSAASQGCAMRAAGRSLPHRHMHVGICPEPSTQCNPLPH